MTGQFLKIPCYLPCSQGKRMAPQGGKGGRGVAICGATPTRRAHAGAAAWARRVDDTESQGRLGRLCPPCAARLCEIPARLRKLPVAAKNFPVAGSRFPYPCTQGIRLKPLRQ
jgi:hypothetical protein